MPTAAASAGSPTTARRRRDDPPPPPRVVPRRALDRLRQRPERRRSRDLGDAGGRAGAAPADVHEDFVTDTTPTWSSDGRSIAFVSDRAGTETPDVYVMRRTGTDVRPVTPTDDAFDSTVPEWSPDGRLIA